ncbi:LysR family transcriptional regulator (plasmid) [Aminobacter sp. SR38]|jgi:DNA-binding transcriptional LysR family regulator|uniref:LysR substrate-binding domain-containing protein n=1 Tax=Aminobacter sp. SR38 TaxID=2774562 RepID=UPI00177FB033|nr:LysR substrate-binding domain-containing protein [Aminobacter sp. SR38]QOF75718.1 LysR family transcriptional regulator [Aminobacter sp. SR38]
MLNVRLLRCFVAVADELSFTAAAARLHMAQPALTRSIKQLEVHINARLLARDTRNVRLTEIGHAFLEQARAALDQLARTERIGHEMARGQLGQVKIGYMTFIAQDFLAPLLRRYSLDRPDIRIELFNMGTEQQRAALVDRAIDVGFMLGPFSIAGVATCTIRDEDLVVAMPDDHPLTHLEAITPLDLQGEKLVMGSESMWSVYRRIIFAEFDRLGVSPQIAQEAPTQSAVFALVGAGMGVTIYPRGPSRYLTDRFALRPFVMEHKKMQTICAWNKAHANPAVSALLDHLAASPLVGASH